MSSILHMKDYIDIRVKITNKSGSAIEWIMFGDVTLYVLNDLSICASELVE